MALQIALTLTLLCAAIVWLVMLARPYYSRAVEQVLGLLVLTGALSFIASILLLIWG